MSTINWTTIISSAVVAVVIGIFQLVANRYTNKMLDQVERIFKNNKEAK